MGTHDVSLLDLSDGVFEVLASDGDTHLGGKDIDDRIVKWIADGIKSDCGVDVTGDTMAMQRIKEAAEKAKIELSSSTTTEINLPYITADSTGPKHFVQSLSRAAFEQMIDDIVKRTMVPVERVLQAAKLDKSEVDEILLVGGSTRIPCIVKAVEDYFGKPASKSINPDEAVSCGACIEGSLLLDPDSVGDGKDILLLDVTPLTLGIETLGGVMTPMIEANTTIPTKKEQVYSTAEDNQTAVTIHVLQAPRDVHMAKNCKTVGMFNLEGIAPAPRGIPQIEVTFNIDANGILSVSAKDKATGKEQSIKIEASSGLSKEEIERMKAEAEANAEADKKEFENATKANTAEQMAFQIKKTLEEDAKDFADETQKESINKKADEILEAVKNKEYDKLDALQEELNKEWSPVVTKMYESKQAQQPVNETTTSTESTSASDAETATEEVQDADFEEVK